MYIRNSGKSKVYTAAKKVKHRLNYQGILNDIIVLHIPALVNG